MVVRLTTDLSNVLTVENLGRTQKLTPEGFLLCEDCRIARIGEQLYKDEEIGLKGDADGIVRVQRDPEEVFSPETLASFVGKPVVVYHPDEMVAPENVKEHMVGVTLNPRRGEGIDDDFMMGDLLIMDKEAIQAVREKRLKQLSAGYDCEYEQTGPGRGRQHKIIGNHVALVDQARCGQRCSVGDEDMAAKAKRISLKDRLMSLVRTRDEAGLTKLLQEHKDELPADLQAGGEETMMDDMEAGGHHIHIHMPGQGEDRSTKDEPEETGATGGSVEDRLAALEEAVAAIANAVQAMAGAGGEGDGGAAAIEEPGEEGEAETEKPEEDEASVEKEEEAEEKKADEEGKSTGDRKGSKDGKKIVTKDSAGLETNFKNAVARAEILMPGIRLPTFDAKAAPDVTTKRLCAFRRRVLDQAMKAGGEPREFVEPHLTKDGLATMDCGAVRGAFDKATADARKANNDGNAAGFGGKRKTADTQPRLSDKIAGLNKELAAHWGPQAHPTRQ